MQSLVANMFSSTHFVHTKIIKTLLGPKAYNVLKVPLFLKESSSCFRFPAKSADRAGWLLTYVKRYYKQENLFIQTGDFHKVSIRVLILTRNGNLWNNLFALRERRLSWEIHIAPLTLKEAMFHTWDKNTMRWTNICQRPLGYHSAFRGGEGETNDTGEATRFLWNCICN